MPSVSFPLGARQSLINYWKRTIKAIVHRFVPIPKREPIKLHRGIMREDWRAGPLEAFNSTSGAASLIIGRRFGVWQEALDRAGALSINRRSHRGRRRTGPSPAREFTSWYMGIRSYRPHF